MKSIHITKLMEEKLNELIQKLDALTEKVSSLEANMVSKSGLPKKYQGKIRIGHSFRPCLNLPEKGTRCMFMTSPD